MYIHYDPEGDILEIRFGKPTASSFEKVYEDVFERVDDKTNEITGYTIYNLKKRQNALELPALV